MRHELIKFHGDELTPHPINVDLAVCQARLAHRDAVRVILEPGDATRYELIVAQISGGFAVTRINSEYTATVLIGTSWHRDEFKPLASNAWTREVIDWWLRCMLDMPFNPEISELV